MKSGIFMFLICLTSIGALHAQNITNTLGVNGIFSINDGSTTYLTLSQSNGLVGISKNLSLSNSPGSVLGILYKGNDRFLHTYYSAGTSGNNTFLGINSGNLTMSGSGSQSSNNTGIGHSSLFSLTTGTQNTGVGTYTLYSSTTGYSNTAIGVSSLFSNTTGYENTSVGTSTLEDNTTGYDNSAFGYGSLSSNTSGHSNTGIGVGSLLLNTTGYSNTAVGMASLLFNVSGYNNTSVGFSSLNKNTTGYDNTSIGMNSLFFNTTGFHNTALGYDALYANTTGTSNVAAGWRSLYSNTTGTGNTSVGYDASYNNSTGFFNTALGYFAGFNITTGNNLTCIGYNSQPSSGAATNQITLGNSSVTSLRCNVQNITSLSDNRDKKNIQDLSIGLDFLMKVKPRMFNWDKREWYENNVSNGSKMQVESTAGFIAQELDEVQTTENALWLNLVLKDNHEKLEATSGNLLPIIVKAIQDLKTENDALKVMNDQLRESLLKLEQMQDLLAGEIEIIRSEKTGIKGVKLVVE